MLLSIKRRKGQLVFCLVLLLRVQAKANELLIKQMLFLFWKCILLNVFQTDRTNHNMQEITGGMLFQKKNRIQTGFRERSLKFVKRWFHFFNVSVNANKDVKILWGNKYIQLDKNAILLKVRQKFLEIWIWTKLFCNKTNKNVDGKVSYFWIKKEQEIRKKTHWGSTLFRK